MEVTLETELTFVEKEKQHLLKEYLGKYLLVKGEKIVGSFDSYEKAADEGVRIFGIDDTFLVYLMVSEQPVNFVMGAVL